MIVIISLLYNKSCADRLIEYDLFDQGTLIVAEMKQSNGTLCDQHQCETIGKCPANSDCLNKCDKYQCLCRTGFVAVNNICMVKQCSNGFTFNPYSNQCERVCPIISCLCGDNEICKSTTEPISGCEVKRCECLDGYHRQNIKKVCKRDCPPFSECNCPLNEFCMTKTNSNGCEFNTCVCSVLFERILGECQKICPVGYRRNKSTNNCEFYCPYSLCTCGSNQKCLTYIDSNGCDRKTCTNIEEFQKRNMTSVRNCKISPCRCVGVNENCINTTDEYGCIINKCVCEDGFQWNANMKECMRMCPPLEECPCYHNEKCHIAVDQFGCKTNICTCRDGYKKARHNNTCRKICKSGYKKNPLTKRCEKLCVSESLCPCNNNEQCVKSTVDGCSIETCVCQGVLVIS